MEIFTNFDHFSWFFNTPWKHQILVIVNMGIQHRGWKIFIGSFILRCIHSDWSICFRFSHRSVFSLHDKTTHAIFLPTHPYKARIPKFGILNLDIISIPSIATPTHWEFSMSILKNNVWVSLLRVWILGIWALIIWVDARFMMKKNLKQRVWFYRVLVISYEHEITSSWLFRHVHQIFRNRFICQKWKRESKLIIW